MALQSIREFDLLMNNLQIYHYPVLRLIFQANCTSSWHILTKYNDLVVNVDLSRKYYCEYCATELNVASSDSLSNAVNERTSISVGQQCNCGSEETSKWI